MADTSNLVSTLDRSIDGAVLITNVEGTFACLKAAYDAGVNFFDCAENYSAGESEKVMGDAIKHFGWKRNDLVPRLACQRMQD